MMDITDAEAKKAGFPSAAAMKAFYAQRSASLRQKNYLTEKGAAQGGAVRPSALADDEPQGGGLLGYVARAYKRATGQ